MLSEYEPDERSSSRSDLEQKKQRSFFFSSSHPDKYFKR